MQDQRQGDIPIGDARRIAEERRQPIVVVFGLDATGERFNVTTYGQTKKLCKLAASFGEQFGQAIFDGRVAPPAMEPPDRPRIVCLCGSTRFYEAFQRANYEETMAGRIVLSVGFYPHSQATHGHGEGVGHDSAEKVALDELHKRKIDLADEVLVLNVGGYVGSSTRSEIEYAREHGKPVRWLEPEAAQ